MKFAFFLAFLAFTASCITAQNITSWGDVHNTAIFHEERVVAEYQFFRIQNRTVTYQTMENATIRWIIRGIMHIDYQETFSTPTISSGGIDTPIASLNILSQRGYGINSTVRFYL